MALVNTVGFVNMSSDVAVAANGTVPIFIPTGPIFSVTVANGGSGYTVGDVLTLDAGDGGATGFGAKVTVLTAPGGIIGTVSILNAGDGYNMATGGQPYATTGGTGASDCQITVVSITQIPIEITVKSITASTISTAAGLVVGAVSLQEGSTFLHKCFIPPWTAIAAGEGRTAFFPVNFTFSPKKILQVRYTQVANASTAAINVVWSRGRE